jgi:hypothetical protein
MPSIKLHVFRTEIGDDGTESCDFRGSGEHGAGTYDHHRTVEEIDPATDEQIAFILENGPAANKVFAMMAESQHSFAGGIASLLGLEGDGPIGLRLGVWDK